MKNTALIILLVLMVLSIGFYVALQERPQTQEFPNEPLEISEGPITESGVITCIPKIGTGAQTMECALGLKNSEGLYYGLKYLSDHDENFSFVSPEITVLITGILVDEEMFGPDGNRYDTVGTIEIENITEI